MAYDILEMLNECESLVNEGRMKTFVVCVEEGRLLIQPDGNGQSKTAQLTDELKVSFQIFFDDTTSIQYLSPDYNILKSLISAQACIGRMKSKE
jgi:hypothetical protein